MPAEPNEPSPRVVAVVLTFRRTDLLRRTVDALAAQSRKPDLILVIDNDGLAGHVLDGREGVEVLETGENLGPAGGYAFGFREALDRGFDRIWTVDDDVIPEPECLERLLAADAAVAVPLQRKPGGVRGFPPSWNGPLFDSAVVREVGLPRADLFFWAEDTEYVTRIRLAGYRRTPVPDAIVMHLNPGSRVRGQPRDWQLYYEVRNTLEYRLRIRPTGRGALTAIGSTVAKAAAILLFEPRKARSLSLWWRGVRDFVRGRLGKVIDPEAWEDRA